MHPWEWNEAYLLSLVHNKVPESVGLEYNSSDALENTDAKKREISKDVSAMANAAGGTIIYGIKTYKDPGKKYLPEDIDNGVDPALVTAEWLEQVVPSNIQPHIEGLRINPVKLDTQRPGKVAYAVYVPQSHTAHQAADKRYYGRVERTTVSLEDYQIRDIFNRVKHPILELKFEREDLRISQDDHWYALRVVIINTGTVAAQNIVLVLQLPDVMVVQDERFAIPPNNQTFSRKHIKWLRNTGRMTFCYAGSDGSESYLRFRLENVEEPERRLRILFPEDRLEMVGKDGLWQIYLNVTHENYERLKGRTFQWRIYADNAPPRSGEEPVEGVLHNF